MDKIYDKVQKVLATKSKKKRVITVWQRSAIIFKEYVGLKFKVYQGTKFINVLVLDEMVGFRFGEFAPTRVRHEYKKKRGNVKK